MVPVWRDVEAALRDFGEEKAEVRVEAPAPEPRDPR